jgi:hypothetical protein
MPRTIKRSAQNSNVFRAPGIMSSQVSKDHTNSLLSGLRTVSCERLLAPQKIAPIRTNAEFQ